MTRFLKTADHDFINADRIERLERGGATLTDGTFVELSAKQDIDRLLAPVVAATPGFIRLRYYADGGGDGTAWVERLPIVAWRVCRLETYPVVPGDTLDGSGCDGEALLLPDGQVLEPFVGRAASEKEWLAEMEKQAASARLSARVQAEEKARAKPKAEAPADG
jgi:hypothetical protein